MEVLTEVNASSPLRVGNKTLAAILPRVWWLGPGQRAVVVVGLALLEGAGILLNLAIFTAFAREGAGRAVGGALPINLVLSDLLTTGCVLPLLISFFHTTTWPLESAGCQVFGFTFHLFGGVSIYTMTAIAIERQYTITHGHQGISKLTRQQGKFVAASWLLSLLLAAPPLLGWSSYHMDAETGTCAPDWTTRDGQHVSYLVFLAVFGFLLPIAVQAGCYLKLCNTVFSVAKRARAMEMSFLQSTVAVISFPMVTLAHGSAQPFLEQRHKNNSPGLGSALSILLKRQTEFQNLRRLAKLMMSMVLVQVMSWLPYVVGLLVLLFLQGAAHPQALTITMMISTFNVIYNPVMYVYHNRKYRSTVSRCLYPVTSHIRRSCHRHPSDDEDDPTQGEGPGRDDPGREDPGQQTRGQQQPRPQQQGVPEDLPQDTPPAAAAGLDSQGGVLLLPSQSQLRAPLCPRLYTVREGSFSSGTTMSAGSKDKASHLPFPSVRQQSGFQFARSSRGNMVQTPLGFNSGGGPGVLPAEQGQTDTQ